MLEDIRVGRPIVTVSRARLLTDYEIELLNLIRVFYSLVEPDLLVIEVLPNWRVSSACY